MAQPGLILDDRYRLDDRIAAGGMGEVWRATDLMLGRPVAVKLVQAHYAQDEEGLARFRAEARYAGALQHPNIAMVYDYWEGDPPGQPYLVMELVDGPSLAGVLEQQGPIGPVPTLDVVAQTAAGLQVAHAAGLVHRDIKPANLLISPGGLLKITDFGIARADAAANLTMTGQVIGTVAYMAPERVSGQSATPASDLYALGMVAHECLTGERPFEGEPMAVALAQMQRELPPLPAWVPPELAQLVTDLTAKDPRLRPASAGEVAERAVRVRAALTGSGGPALAGLQAAGATMPAAAVAGERFAATAAAGGYGGAGQTVADLPVSGTGGYGDDLGDGRPSRNRRLLAVAAGVAALAVAGLIGWLVFAQGSPPPKPAAVHHSHGRHSTATPSSVASTQSSQPATGGGQPTTPPPPSPTPSATPTPTPSASPSPTPTVSTPPASPSATATGTSPPTAAPASP